MGRDSLPGIRENGPRVTAVYETNITNPKPTPIRLNQPFVSIISPFASCSVPHPFSRSSEVLELMGRVTACYGLNISGSIHSCSSIGGGRWRSVKGTNRRLLACMPASFRVGGCQGRQSRGQTAVS